MKKRKRKSLIKTARKAIKDDIKQNLIIQMKDVAGKLVQGSKKLDKEIEKSSKQLAKKLSKELKITEITLSEADSTQKKSAAVDGKVEKPAEPKVNGTTSKTRSVDDAKTKPTRIKGKSAKKTSIPTEV